MVILRKARSAVRLLQLLLEEARERRELSSLYTDVHGNLDPAVHLQEAMAWLCRAQDFGADRGVAYGTPFGKGFLPSYPETTGYIICTFVSLAKRQNREDYLGRAIEMGDWEISLQVPSGAAGMYLDNPKSAMFDTGMVLLGWADLFRATGAQRFADAGRRAAEWMVELQEPNGHWIRGNDHGYANPHTTLYNCKAAWGLAEMGQALGESRYIDAAVRNAEYTLTRQTANGWFEDCCLIDAERPLLHTIAYTMQGLTGIGKISGRQDFIEGAARTADSLRKLMDRDGFIPGEIRRDFTGAVKYCCLTGSAQTSQVWSELEELTGDASWGEAAETVNRYLMARHDITNSDPTIRGGLAGSWPVWGKYGRLKILNWATKFFADALALRLYRAKSVSAGAS